MRAPLGSARARAVARPLATALNRSRGHLLLLLLGVAAAITLVWPAAAVSHHDGFPPPTHDAGNAAFRIALNSTLENHGTRGATTQPGEWLTCSGRSYGHTVWYVFDVPAKGQVVVTTRGTSIYDGLPLDTIVAVSGPGSVADPPIKCDDDGTGEIGGGSRVDLVLDAGTYYIQVGTYDYDTARPDFRPAVPGPDVGSFSIELRYVQDLDLDDDGVPADRDCVDQNPRIYPGAVDIEFNGVDEDCSGRDDRDGDDDGYDLDVDCRDDIPGVNPGVREVPGDFEDENCDGEEPAAQLDPFPSVVFPSLAYRGRTLVKKLQVKDVRQRYEVTVNCKGGRRLGCPRSSRRVLKSSKSVTIRGYTRRFLRPGAVVRVYVTQPDTNTKGKFASFRIRRGKAPKRIDCRLLPGRRKPAECRS